MPETKKHETSIIHQTNNQSSKDMKTATIANDYGIREALDQLGIKEINNGACTGANWFNTNGEMISSYSSADGSLIGQVKQGTADDYEKIIVTAQEAFKT